MGSLGLQRRPLLRILCLSNGLPEMHGFASFTVCSTVCISISQEWHASRRSTTALSRSSHTGAHNPLQPASPLPAQPSTAAHTATRLVSSAAGSSLLLQPAADHTLSCLHQYGSQQHILCPRPFRSTASTSHPPIQQVRHMVWLTPGRVRMRNKSPSPPHNPVSLRPRPIMTLEDQLEQMLKVQLPLELYNMGWYLRRNDPAGATELLRQLPRVMAASRNLPRPQRHPYSQPTLPLPPWWTAHLEATEPGHVQEMQSEVSSSSRSGAQVAAQAPALAARADGPEAPNSTKTATLTPESSARTSTLPPDASSAGPDDSTSYGSPAGNVNSYAYAHSSQYYTMLAQSGPKSDLGDPPPYDPWPGKPKRPPPPPPAHLHDYEISFKMYRDATACLDTFMQLFSDRQLAMCLHALSRNTIAPKPGLVARMVKILLDKDGEGLRKSGPEAVSEATRGIAMLCRTRAQVRAELASMLGSASSTGVEKRLSAHATSTDAAEVSAGAQSAAAASSDRQGNEATGVAGAGQAEWDGPNYVIGALRWAWQWGDRAERKLPDMVGHRQERKPARADQASGAGVQALTDEGARQRQDERTTIPPPLS